MATTSSNPDHCQQRIVRKYLLIWIDRNIDQSNKECQNTLTQLRNVVDDVTVFTEHDKCVDFLTDIQDTKVFMVAGGTLGRQIIPLIHDIPQLDALYIFCRNKSQHEKWTKQWAKVKGVHTEIELICESIHKAVKQCHQDSIAVSFVTLNEDVSSQNLDQLEPSFMYTQIFKEILLGMEHNQQSIKDFVAYCRKGNYGSLENIARFENNYNAELAIWWYTYPSFIYSMLNSALRMLEAGMIINMGFFIHDLHHQIEQIHQKQVTNYHNKSFTVYRGQGLSTEDFEKLLSTKGGLMSFNNFLSTSKNQELPRGLAYSALEQTGQIGILFQMHINPSISSAPFADIREVSYFHEEEEILFSMHTVFRIGEITNIDNDSSLYQVELTLTADDDEQLRVLTDRIRKETAGTTGSERLGELLLKLHQSDKAEELYKTLLEQTLNEDEKAFYYHQLGCVKNDQGDYETTIWYYEKALEINRKILAPNDPRLASLYNSIGLVYAGMGEYSKAVSFFEKALEIEQKTLPPNHSSLAAFYNSLSMVYEKMGEYSKALSFCEQTRQIFEKTLPPNHPSLATCYNNIGVMYQNMGEYSKALAFYEKALEIEQKALPPNHPSLATSYDNIGLVYDSIGQYSKALSFHEKAVEIRQKIFPPNHPELAVSYCNIGAVYQTMEDYSKALSFHETALEIRQKALSPMHHHLAQSYNNIASLNYDMKNYSKAHSYFQRALDIWQHSLPSNHRYIQGAREWMEKAKKNL